MRLTGNKLGTQKIYLRADQKLDRYVAVNLSNNILLVTEKTSDGVKELLRLDLDRFDGKEILSVAEDKRNAEVRELEALAKYADSPELAKQYYAQSTKKESGSVPTVEQGEKKYVPNISVHAKGNRLVNLLLQDNQLQVRVNGKEAINGVVSDLAAGSVALESAWGGYGWSQRNLADDVYDGVFEGLVLKEIPAAGQEKILYSDKLSGFDSFSHRLKKVWNAVVNWFIVHL